MPALFSVGRFRYRLGRVRERAVRCFGRADVAQTARLHMDSACFFRLRDRFVTYISSNWISYSRKGSFRQEMADFNRECDCRTADSVIFLP